MRTRWALVTGERSGRRLIPDVAAAATTFAVFVAIVLAGWDPVLAADDAILEALNDLVGPSGTAVAVLHILTDLGGAQAAWLLIPLTVLWLALRRLPRAAAYAAVTGLGALVLDPAMKALVSRSRPVLDVTVATAPGPSFPSGHALGATVTYGLLLLVFLPAVPRDRRRAVAAAAVVLVAIVGITRIALGVHHPSDVLAGWSLGVLWLGTTNVAFVRATDGRPGGEGDPRRLRRALQPAPRGGDPLPEGVRSIAGLVIAAVLLWGALLGLGELLSDPSGVVLRFDAALIDWLVAIRSEWLSDAATAIGLLGGTIGIVSGAAVSAVVALAVTRRWRPPLFIVAAVVGETAIFLATVTIVERGRPQVPVVPANLPPTPSFPSGHVAATLALYGAVALLVAAWSRRSGRPWIGRLAFLVAFLAVMGVSLARMYEGVHYPTDVIASILFAAVWLGVCWRVLRPAPSAAASQREQPTQQPVHGRESA